MPFALLGVLVPAFARRGRELAWLLALPLYFILVGSLTHMEHRYIVVIYYLLPILAVVPICNLTGMLKRKLLFAGQTLRWAFQSRTPYARTLLPNETIADAADGKQMRRFGRIFFNIFS